MLPFAALETIGLNKSLFEQGHITAKEVSLAADTTVFQSGDPCGAF